MRDKDREYFEFGDGDFIVVGIAGGLKPHDVIVRQRGFQLLLQKFFFP